MVRTWLSSARGAGSIPGRGAKIPHASRPKKPKHKTETILRKTLKMVHIKKILKKKKKKKGWDIILQMWHNYKQNFRLLKTISRNFLIIHSEICHIPKIEVSISKQYDCLSRESLILKIFFSFIYEHFEKVLMIQTVVNK